jgi:hypothetical protein
MELPIWGSSPFEEKVEWISTAYPVASSHKTAYDQEVKTTGLDGTLYGQGGKGQGLRELDLGVNFAPDRPEDWQGISGAPVFVNSEFVGFIKSVPESFGGKRLTGSPIELLLQNSVFRTAIAPTPDWLKPFPREIWCLLLCSENVDSTLLGHIRQSVHQNRGNILRAAGERVDREPRGLETREVSVNDVLPVPGDDDESWSEPERLLQFLRPVCAAPIMIVDVSGFQPAVMLILGIRAVVRRGVTIIVTSETFDETLLSKLPFNIQETKLIFSGYEISNPQHPRKMVGTCIEEGLQQLKGHMNYLDLPVYDAVRCPKPGQGPEGPPIEDTVFMLCSFQPRYKANWKYVADEIVAKKPDLVRMSDIASPQLVGQALYEHIRWMPCCIVDWTHWRPNVFFECGVRLACSDIGPVHLIEEGELESNEEADPWPLQRKQLIALLRPTPYRLKEKGSESIRSALDRYDAILNEGVDVAEPGIPAHNASYQMIVDAFDWTQEHIIRPPHEELRASAEAQLGPDPQKTGTSPILFSSNRQFARELRKNVQERWIAAWYYLRYRHTHRKETDEELVEFRTNKQLREEILSLSEIVLQSLKGSRDAAHERVREEISELIDELEEV